MNVARCAPSAGNRQPWIFIVVTDPKMKKRHAKIHMDVSCGTTSIAIACDENTSLRNVEEIQKILNLPPNCISISSAYIGIPQNYLTPKSRKELREIVFLNLYGNPLP